MWNIIKITFIISYVYVSILLSNFIFKNIIKNFIKETSNPINSPEITDNANSLSLVIGENSNNSQIKVPESGLYQNFLITGTIGSGKTSSAMYPFTEQLIKYNSAHPNDKIGMLILDVKGNYYSQVQKYAEKYNLTDDLIVIELNSNVKYNPLHKPNLRPQVLSNRLRTILELFSENNQESYWLDTAEHIISESIKLCRLYNNGYVTFDEIHKLISSPEYYKEKVSYLRNLFMQSKFTTKEIYDLNTSLDFFQKEFYSLDQRTFSILKSEISRITNVFISDFDIRQTFSPAENVPKHIFAAHSFQRAT